MLKQAGTKHDLRLSNHQMAGRSAPKRSTSHVLQSLDRRSTIGAKTTRQVSIDNAPSGLVASSNLVNSWGKKTGTGRALCQPIQFATLNSNRFCCWPRQTVTRCSPALNPLMVFENCLEAIFLPSSFKTTSSLSKPYRLIGQEKGTQLIFSGLAFFGKMWRCHDALESVQPELVSM